jgi:prolyl-tRNA synthetase
MAKKDKGNKGLSVKKDENFSEWYTEVVQKAELADYAPVKGFMIIRPNAYSIWEKIQEWFNKDMKNFGVRNSYFPLLIPDSFFKKEAEHAKGFAPELAYVAGTEDGEKLAIRPTSETIIYDSFSKWIRSWRDLPLLLNQWCNVLRWEVKQTKPFLRTREFLWQEGHCAFADEKGAVKNRDDIIAAYKKMLEDLLAIPVLLGRKSKLETFPGAKETLAIESLMPDGKALQMGTSHVLDQGFSKVFDMKFKGEDEMDHFVWTTSWGVSTRLIGAVVMVHGDDKGLVIPPKVAEKKVVVVPIVNGKDDDVVLIKAQEVFKRLENFGVILDDREGYSPGWKFNEWEMKGIPLRIEIGPRDVAAKKVTVVRRDNGKKEQVGEGKIANEIEKYLESMQRDLFSKALKFLKGRNDSASTMPELKKKLKEGKIVKVYMKDDEKVEGEIKDETGGAVSRIIEVVAKEGKCIRSGEMVKTIGYIAKAY